MDFAGQAGQSWTGNCASGKEIDKAAEYVALEYLALSPQCGFASTSRGNLLTIDEERRKLALVAETAEKVWG